MAGVDADSEFPMHTTLLHRIWEEIGMRYTIRMLMALTLLVAIAAIVGKQFIPEPPKTMTHIPTVSQGDSTDARNR